MIFGVFFSLVIPVYNNTCEETVATNWQGLEATQTMVTTGFGRTSVYGVCDAAGGVSGGVYSGVFE